MGLFWWGGELRFEKGEFRNYSLGGRVQESNKCRGVKPTSAFRPFVRDLYLNVSTPDGFSVSPRLQPVRYADLKAFRCKQTKSEIQILIPIANT